MSEKIVVAFGGNAILKSNERGTAEEQRVNVRQACLAAAALVKAGNQVVITHGNGPQVGAVLLQNELAADTVPVMPLDVCGAATQGQIGYMIQQALGNILRESGVSKPVASVVTQVLVGVDDPAFANPTKPIGSYYPVDQARSLMTEKGWKMVEDKARGGFRRVVPSPMPLQIVEKDAIGALLEAGYLVIASGGGGIPVIEQNGALVGVEAVIDKDLAGERLAQDIAADTLMILTDVSQVALHFNTPEQVNLGRVTLDEAREYAAQGHFKAGSMGPKMGAAIKFLENGGRRSIITALHLALDAIEGHAGTIITRD